MNETNIIVIGSMELAEIAYSGLALSDTAFNIVGFLIDSCSEQTSFHDIDVLPFNNITTILENTAFDFIFIFSELEVNIRSILLKLGIDSSSIKNKDDINDYLTKKQRMQFLKEEMFLIHHSKYASSNILVGDFTYGIPLILMDKNNKKTSFSIGKFCSIAHGVTVYLGGNHRSDWNSTYPFNIFIPNYQDIKGHPVTNGDVKIGNDVWIGSDAKIMSGVTIGDGAIIGANALITKDVLPYTVVGGIPAQIIRKRFDNIRISQFEDMQWWNWDYEDIYNVIPYLQNDSFYELNQYYEEHVK